MIHMFMSGLSAMTLQLYTCIQLIVNNIKHEFIYFGWCSAALWCDEGIQYARLPCLVYAKKVILFSAITCSEPFLFGAVLLKMYGVI